MQKAPLFFLFKGDQMTPEQLALLKKNTPAPLELDTAEDTVIKLGKQEPPVKKICAGEIKNFNEKERTFDAILSTEEVDRDGDILSVAGWKLNEYRKNPVILWKHDQSIPALGVATKVWKEDGKLMFTPKFAPAEVHPFADQIFKLYQLGILRAFSVRFDPYKWEDLPAKEAPKQGERQYFGRKYVSQGVLEASCVNVPANAGCLVSREYQEMLVKSYQFETLKGYAPEEQQVILAGLGIAKCATCRACKPEPKTLISEADQATVMSAIADLQKVLTALEAVKGIEVLKKEVDDILDATVKDVEQGKQVDELLNTMKMNAEIIARVGATK